MKRTIFAAIIIALLIVALLFLVSAERYQRAVDWAENGIFSKATCYVDEFPFIIELYDPGFISYVYAGKAMEYGHYDDAIKLLKPLAEKSYRDSFQMLHYCIDQITQLPN